MRLSRQDQLFRFVTSHGYRLYRVSDNRLTRVTAIGIHDEVAMSNYVLIPDGEPECPPLEGEPVGGYGAWLAASAEGDRIVYQANRRRILTVAFMWSQRVP